MVSALCTHERCLSSLSDLPDRFLDSGLRPVSASRSANAGHVPALLGMSDVTQDVVYRRAVRAQRQGDRAVANAVPCRGEGLGVLDRSPMANRVAGKREQPLQHHRREIDQAELGFQARRHRFAAMAGPVRRIRFQRITTRAATEQDAVRPVAGDPVRVEIGNGREGATAAQARPIRRDVLGLPRLVRRLDRVGRGLRRRFRGPRSRVFEWFAGLGAAPRLRRSRRRAR